MIVNIGRFHTKYRTKTEFVSKLYHRKPAKTTCNIMKMQDSPFARLLTSNLFDKKMCEHYQKNMYLYLLFWLIFCI